MKKKNDVATDQVTQLTISIATYRCRKCARSRNVSDIVAYRESKQNNCQLYLKILDNVVYTKVLRLYKTLLEYKHI